MTPLHAFDLRPANNADVPEVWTLITTVLGSYGIATDRCTTDGDLSDLEAEFAPEKGRFWVLTDGGRIIGTVALRFFPNGRVELCRMYLLPEYRGCGLGRALLNHALAEARSLRAAGVFLKTAAVLKEAVQLYQSVGFERSGCRSMHENCDTVMELRL